MPTRHRYYRDLVKPFFDRYLAVAALLATLPLMLVVALAVRVFHGSPVIFVQNRLGRRGRQFRMFKFRTMRHGPRPLGDDETRLTTLGRFLRRFSLDELPQLWNVLRGEMSLVGPRPERPVFVKQFRHEIPHYMLRHKVKAGITGWAQVNGWRGNTSLEKRIEYDLYYIEHWSVTLDLKIMWLTLVRGLFQRA